MAYENRIRITAEYMQKTVIFSSLGRFVKVPQANPLGTSQTSLGFRRHLITNFPHVMVLHLLRFITRKYTIIYANLKLVNAKYTHFIQSTFINASVTFN